MPIPTRTANVASPRSGQARMTAPIPRSTSATRMFAPRPTGSPIAATKRTTPPTTNQMPTMSAKTTQRLERLLDQHESRDRTEHADRREQPAPFAPAEDRPEDREHAVHQQEDADDHREGAECLVRREDEEQAHAERDEAEQRGDPPEARGRAEVLDGFGGHEAGVTTWPATFLPRGTAALRG